MTLDRDAVARWYHRSDRLLNATFIAIRGCFEGIWLGVLSRDQAALVDKVYYDRHTMYVTESYNRGGLFPWEQAAIDKYFGGVRKIIVTSAGGGREVLALDKAGYQVIGFEPHQDLARFGNRLLAVDGISAEIRLSERDGFPPDVDDAEGVIVGWGGYMLIPGRSRRVAFLKEAATRLPAQAPLLVSFHPRLADENVRFRIVTWLANSLRWLLGRDPIAFGDAMAPGWVHFFTEAEVESEMAEAGFELVDFGTDGYGWAVGQSSDSRSKK